MSPDRTLNEESIRKMLAERENSIGRGDIKRFLELTERLGMGIEPEYGDQIERYQVDLMMTPDRTQIKIPQSRPNTPIDYQTLLKTEGNNFGMGREKMRKYLDYFSEPELGHIWMGWNNIVLKPEMLILYPEGAIILPFAASIVKKTNNPKHKGLFVTDNPYELVKGLNDVAFSYDKIRRMNAEYVRTNQSRPELILRPGDLEQRLKQLPNEAKDRLIGSFREEYSEQEWHPIGITQHKQEIMLKINKQYEKALEKYGSKKE